MQNANPAFLSKRQAQLHALKLQGDCAEDHLWALRLVHVYACTQDWGEEWNTWEPSKNILGPKLLQDWEDEKRARDRGTWRLEDVSVLEEPLDPQSADLEAQVLEATQGLPGVDEQLRTRLVAAAKVCA